MAIARRPPRTWTGSRRRYKHIVYHGTGLGELFDLERDPGELENLWETAAPALRHELLRTHLDAMMATSGAGPERVAMY